MRVVVDSSTSHNHIMNLAYSTVSAETEENLRLQMPKDLASNSPSTNEAFRLCKRRGLSNAKRLAKEQGNEFWF